MAKQTKKQTAPQVISGQGGDLGPHFVTSTGATFFLHPIPAYLFEAIGPSTDEKWRRTRGSEPPQIPVYAVEVAGETVYYAHDEKTVESRPECRAEWDKWLADKADYDKIYNDTMARIVLYDGVEVREYLPEWERGMKARGLTIPTDPNERKIIYAKTNTPTTAEAVHLINAILRLGGVSQEALDRAEATFRRKVGK